MRGFYNRRIALLLCTASSACNPESLQTVDQIRGWDDRSQRARDGIVHLVDADSLLEPALIPALRTWGTVRFAVHASGVLAIMECDEDIIVVQLGVSSKDSELVGRRGKNSQLSSAVAIGDTVYVATYDGASSHVAALRLTKGLESVGELSVPGHLKGLTVSKGGRLFGVLCDECAIVELSIVESRVWSLGKICIETTDFRNCTSCSTALRISRDALYGFGYRGQLFRYSLQSEELSFIGARAPSLRGQNLCVEVPSVAMGLDEGAIIGATVEGRVFEIELRTAELQDYGLPFRNSEIVGLCPLDGSRALGVVNSVGGASRLFLVSRVNGTFTDLGTVEVSTPQWTAYQISGVVARAGLVYLGEQGTGKLFQVDVAGL